MPENTATWILEPHGPFVVREAPYTPSDADQVVIENQAAAINPIDWKAQTHNSPSLGLQYPTILGFDVAGTIVEIGSNVQNLAVGDRVLAHCFGSITKTLSQAGFQKICSYQCQVPGSLSRAPFVCSGFGVAASMRYGNGRTLR